MKYINMPVKCIGDKCRNCRELDLDVDRYAMHDSKPETWYENVIYCKHYERCNLIRNDILKELTVEAKFAKQHNPVSDDP